MYLFIHLDIESYRHTYMFTVQPRNHTDCTICMYNKGYNLLFNPHSSERPFSPRWYFFNSPRQETRSKFSSLFRLWRVVFLLTLVPQIWLTKLRVHTKNYKGHLISVGPKIFPVPQIWLAGRVGECNSKFILFPTEFAPWGIGLIWGLYPLLYTHKYMATSILYAWDSVQLFIYHRNIFRNIY